MANINRVVLVGNLTRDPELRHTPSGTAVCSLRLAVNTRRKDGATGEWTEKPNYFDITVWGNQGENCAQYLAKGRPVAHRRPARVARVGGAGRHQAPGGRGGRRHRAVPRRPRRAATAGEAGGNQFVPAGAAASARTQTSAPAAPTTTFRSRRRSSGRKDDKRGGSRKRAAPAPGAGGSRASSASRKVDEIDYKNIGELRRYISEKGKIRSRRISGACRRHQRQVAVAIKRAREMALLPYVAEGRDDARAATAATAATARDRGER